MNLIERLGGYDKAKDHRDYLIDFGNEFNRPSKHEVDSLNDALLEHCRENNIFEVGDLVVYRKHCNLIWDGVYRVDAVLTDGQVIERDLPTPKEWLSHATPEEIKAGHRL